MDNLFNNKYRIPSARLQSWNYANEGMYFITICTKNRINYFGEIGANGLDGPTLQPTEIGKIAHSQWYKSVELRPDMNLELGEFVVMPNHTHGILIIDKMDTINVETLQCNVSTTNATNKNEQMAKISPQSGTISTIIRSYKSVASKNARLIHADFTWQSRFHDHIIRDSQSFENIQHYITNNPINWNKDKFYKNDV